MAELFFTSKTHKERFLANMRSLGKIDAGKLDQEYGAALYILTADGPTWQDARRYVTTHGIDIETMLSDVDLSSGYRVLIQLAGNLFNDRTASSPVDLCAILDARNFAVAMTAFQIRRVSLPIAELEEDESSIDWRAIEDQAQRDLEAITDDASAYRFIEKYFVKDLSHRYREIYRSDRHEMLKTPKQALESLLKLPPLE